MIKFDIVQIAELIKTGLSGLVFLFAYLGYRLLQNEQKKNEPDKNILKSIHQFMILCLVSAILVTLFNFGQMYFIKIIKPMPNNLTFA